jgi:hypothetical protein
LVCHILALIDGARHDGAGHRRADGHHGDGLAGVFQDGDLLGGQAELEQALAGGGALGGGEGVVAGAEALHILALGGEHLGAVDGGERLALAHLGADVVDVEFLDAARGRGRRGCGGGSRRRRSRR